MAPLTLISRIRCSSFKARPRWAVAGVVAGATMRRLVEVCPPSGRRMRPTMTGITPAWSQAGETTPAAAETDTFLAAWFTNLSRCMIRSISPWRDTIPAPTPLRQTTLRSINPLFRWPASEVTAGAAMPRLAEACPSPVLMGSARLSSGGNQAGNGGDGYFYGSIVHASFALYDPINIAVAGYNSSADADQTNNVYVRSIRFSDGRRRR